MNGMRGRWSDAAIRGAVVAGLIVAFGYFVYQAREFIPTTPAFQFVLSGVTSGIACAFFVNGDSRIGAGALALWYLLLMGLIVPAHRLWAHVLDLSYIAGIGGAVYLCLRDARRHPARARFLSMVIAAAIMGVANSLVIVFLALLSPRTAIAHVPAYLHSIYMNLRIGAAMGVLLVVGIGLSERLIKVLPAHRSVDARD